MTNPHNPPRRTEHGAATLLFTSVHRLIAPCLAMCLIWCAVPAVANPGQTIERDGRFLHLEISQDFDQHTQGEIRQWAGTLSDALLQAYGHWPNRHWRMIVAPASAAADDPIPWAQVVRSSLPTIEFYTSPQSTAASLQAAWTGYHELGHLLIPYRGWGDLWFSEGLASYYQNLLQARSGLITEREMWQRLHDGFERGRNDTGFASQTLTAVSDALYEKGGFMRVYWSGARYFLEADARLRQQSGGALTLDLALRRLNACCADQLLSIEEIVQRLDTLNDVTLFDSLYQSARQSLAVAPAERLFASLGIEVRDGTVHLQPIGPGAALRRNIAAPRTLPF
jgi:hypothetical protein